MRFPSLVLCNFWLKWCFALILQYGTLCYVLYSHASRQLNQVRVPKLVVKQILLTALIYWPRSQRCRIFYFFFIWETFVCGPKKNNPWFAHWLYRSILIVTMQKFSRILSPLFHVLFLNLPFKSRPDLRLSGWFQKRADLSQFACIRQSFLRLHKRTFIKLYSFWSFQLIQG